MNAFKTITTSLVLVSAMSFAEPNDPIMGKPYSHLTEEELALRKQKVEEYQGGMLSTEPSGPRYLILDTRKAPDAVSEDVAKVFNDTLKIGVNVEKAGLDGCPMKAAAGKVGEKVLAVVAIIEGCTNSPAVSVFPEERIALVNADKLGDGEKKAERLRKEIWRAIGFVSGVSYSAGTKCVMQPIGSLEELDEIDAKGLGVTALNQLASMFRKYDVKRGGRATYRSAVRQGWAPAPTNDVQKAVWKDENARMEKRKASEKPAEIPAEAK